MKGYFTKEQKKQLWHWIASCFPDNAYQQEYWHMAEIDSDPYDIYILCDTLRESKSYDIRVYFYNDDEMLYQCIMPIKDFKRKVFKLLRRCQNDNQGSKDKEISEKILPEPAE